MAEVIQAELITLQPDQAETYRQNGNAVITELNQLHTWITAQVNTIPASARKLVSTHEAMGYYAEAYKISLEGALQGITTEEKPSAARIRTLVDEVRTAQVPAIFAETIVNPKLIQAVARDAGVRVADRQLFSDSLGEPGSGAETYPKMLIANTQTIVEALGGKFTPFQPQP